MGTLFVGSLLALVVGLIVYSLVRRHRQGQPILCDAAGCTTCASHGICRAARPAASPNQAVPVHFVRRSREVN